MSQDVGVRVPSCAHRAGLTGLPFLFPHLRSHTMARLLYFFPENDLALARNLAHYTAPPAAVKLRRAGATLPLWYGDSGDTVLTQGVNARWLGELRDRFDLTTMPYDHKPDGLAATPWGWSKASRQIFTDIGFDPSCLPSDTWLDHVRELSHRRTAAQIVTKLAERLPFAIAPAASELHTIAQVEEYIRSHHEGTVIKLPWSSSGRGLVATDTDIFGSQRSMLEGMLRRQGSVTGEPRHRKTLDFAMLFTMHGGKCTFSGFSLFNNTQLGSYAGNTLAPQSELARIISEASSATQIIAIRDLLPSVIEDIACGYEGPLGVDMMATDAPDYCIAVAEINFRMTMGHLCRIFYENFIEYGATGTFTIAPRPRAGIIAAHTADGRMRSGTLDLAQPGSDISFTVSL